LFLASASKLLISSTAEVKASILASKTYRKPLPGFEEYPALAESGLGCKSGLGMPVKEQTGFRQCHPSILGASQ
jgi:hypothetical protein